MSSTTTGLAVKRSYGYDKLGRITKAGDERFAFDPAHNIVDKSDESVQDNILKEYNGTDYQHDEFGNLIFRETPEDMQTYTYDLKDQLVKAVIWNKKTKTKEVWQYTYDALGRRISKECIYSDRYNDNACLKMKFLRDGNHLVEEENGKGTFNLIPTIYRKRRMWII